MWNQGGGGGRERETDRQTEVFTIVYVILLEGKGMLGRL